jgi:alpha-glucoside transport system permease protein
MELHSSSNRRRRRRTPAADDQLSGVADKRQRDIGLEAGSAPAAASSPQAQAEPEVAAPPAGPVSPPGPPPRPPRRERGIGYSPGLALLFLLPALIVLGALVIYPIFYTVGRSLFDRAGSSFIGIDNYRQMFEQDATRTAIRNNAIWVVAAPTLATGIGLIFAVLAERVRWQTVFKVAVFMPMAISFLAAGVIFRLVYEQEPERGLANAVVTSVVDAVRAPGELAGARPSQPQAVPRADGGFATVDSFRSGQTVGIGVVGLTPDKVPKDAAIARAPSGGRSGELRGVVWLDFTRGGGGRPGVVDPSERGLPGVDVEAVREGDVAGSATTERDGSFTIDGLERGEYRVRLAGSNFRQPYGGVEWLGPGLVTPAIIASFLWIWIGFAMIVIGAGLAAIPRETLEAARTDGANEWQVFRRVTAPLLQPVLLVVLVTLMINVLKIFDLVFVIAPPSVQDDANVVALEMWRVSFGGAQDQGLGSALSVLLFVLVIPAMIFNIRRLRSEER